MKGLDIGNLDELLSNGHSFRGKYILEWCQSNFDNSDFNISYAAKEIYDTYLSNHSERPINLNNFYYVIYCNAFMRNRIYSISRDTVLSPKFDPDKAPVKLKNMEKVINTVMSFKKLITNKGNKDDKILLDKSIRLLYYRLNLFGIGDIKKLRHIFNNQNDYKKYQLYTIVRDCAVDLKTIYYLIEK